MFRRNSDTFKGIFGLPGQNQNESLHKTDSCNVLSDCSAAAIGATVRLWTRSGILKNIFFSKKLLHSAARDRAPREGYLAEFTISSGFFGLAGLAGWVHN